MGAGERGVQGRRGCPKAGGQVVGGQGAWGQELVHRVPGRQPQQAVTLVVAGS